jgi:hypothetical protein
VPLLQPDQIHFFANENIKPFEQEIIDRHNMAEIRLADVAANPAGEAQSIVNGWARRFKHLLIHLDSPLSLCSKLGRSYHL